MVVVVKMEIKRVQQAVAAAAQQITVEQVLLEALRHRQRKGLQAARRLAVELNPLEAAVVLAWWVELAFQTTRQALAETD